MEEVQDEDGVSKMSLQGYTSFDAMEPEAGRQEDVCYCLLPSGGVAVTTLP